MQTFRPDPIERRHLIGLAELLKNANAQIAAAEKDKEAAKGNLVLWLKARRKLNVDALEIGDAIEIPGVVRIEIDCQTRLAQAALLLEEPLVYERFMRPVAVRKFKPLV